MPGLQNLLFPPIISLHHQNVSHLWLIGPAHFLLYLNPSLFCSDHFVCSPAICQGLFAVVYSVSALFCFLKFTIKHQSSPFRHAGVSFFRQLPDCIFMTAGFCCSLVHLDLQLWGFYAVSSNSTVGFDIFGCKNEANIFLYIISALFLQCSQVLLSSG